MGTLCMYVSFIKNIMHAWHGIFPFVCIKQVGISGDQVHSNQLGRSEQQHAGQEQQPHRPLLATTTAVPATAFLISRPTNPVSNIVPPAMQHASVVLDHDQFHVPAILLHHDKFQVWFHLILYIFSSNKTFPLSKIIP